MYVCIYIYIHRERERERDIDMHKLLIYASSYMCLIYIYMYIFWSAGALFAPPEQHATTQHNAIWPTVLQHSPTAGICDLLLSIEPLFWQRSFALANLNTDSCHQCLQHVGWLCTKYALPDRTRPHGPVSTLSLEVLTLWSIQSVQHSLVIYSRNATLCAFTSCSL